MNKYLQMSATQLQEEFQAVRAQYKEMSSKGLNLDMSRGKPGADQLELSMDMLSQLSEKGIKSASGIDTRNYGLLDGLPETKALFAQLLNVPSSSIVVGGNSSLNLMYDAIARAMSLGICGSTPWCKLERVKFLCPVPGYDRHFAICELFGIDMINIPMSSTGPDMDMVRQLVESDEDIKGIWCVPMYSNPSGVTYSDETVKAFANLKPKAADFRIYWDNAYCVHHLTDTPDTLLNIFEECEKAGNPDIVFGFASTSKISFSGSGIAVIAASAKNIAEIKRSMTIQTIGHDKMNQLRHSLFFKDADAVALHMKKHRAILEPKFKAVFDSLEAEISPLGIGDYNIPRGGYFVSFNTLPGCAKRVYTLCKEAGVTLTGAGASFPYGVDPSDRNIRLAPTFPPVVELETAMKLFCICVRMASLEKLIREKMS